MMNAYALGYIPLKNSCMMLLYLASQPPIYPQYGGSALMQPVARSIASSIATPFRSVGASSACSVSDRYMVAAIALGSCALGAAVTWWWLDPRGVAKRHELEVERMSSHYASEKLSLNNRLTTSEQNLTNARAQYERLLAESRTMKSRYQTNERIFDSNIASVMMQRDERQDKLMGLRKTLYLRKRRLDGLVDQNNSLKRLCSNLWREVLTYRIYPNPQYVAQSHLISDWSPSYIRLLSPDVCFSPERFVKTSGVHPTCIALMASSNPRMVFDKSDAYQIDCNLIALGLFLQQIEKYKNELEQLNNLYMKQVETHEVLLLSYKNLLPRVESLELVVKDFPERLAVVESKQHEQMRAITKQILSLLQAHCMTVRTSDVALRHNNCLEQIICVLGNKEHTPETLLAALYKITPTTQSSYLSPTASSRGKSPSSTGPSSVIVRRISRSPSTPGSRSSSGSRSVSLSPMPVRRLSMASSDSRDSSPS